MNLKKLMVVSLSIGMLLVAVFASGVVSQGYRAVAEAFDGQSSCSCQRGPFTNTSNHTSRCNESCPGLHNRYRAGTSPCHERINEDDMRGHGRRLRQVRSDGDSRCQH